MRIRLNGQIIQTPHATLHALRDSLYKDGENLVVIVNGFATPDDRPLQEDDEIHMIQKGVLPPKEQLEQMMVARHTPGVHQKVKAAKVAIAGLGGLGSHIAISLARTGVGNLRLIDFDIVEPSNLNRQQYKIKHLGMAKAEALKQEIEEINPYIEVEALCRNVTAGNIPALFSGVDVIVEAFDNPDAKAMLVDGALAHFPHTPIVAASGMAGTAGSNTIRTRKVGSRLYLCGDGDTAAQVGRGLMAPRVGVCAGHQANMVLRLILGETEPD